MAGLVKSPWWVVVAVAVSGAVYANTLTAELQEVQSQVTPLLKLQRDVDSLRIESRHISETVTEIRHLLGREQ